MRKSTILTLVALVAVSAGAWLVLAKPLSSERGLLEGMTRSFVEDLQFKDFRSASLYSHLLDRSRLDIGKTIESLFRVKPEFLDIKDFKLVDLDIDSSGERAKAKVRTRYKILNQSDELKENALILYWIKRHPDCPQGGLCTAGQCANERGEVMYKPLSREELMRRRRESNTPQKGQDEQEREERQDNSVASDDPYSCDVTKEKQWFMNLDSTLKNKAYEDAQRREE